MSCDATAATRSRRGRRALWGLLCAALMVFVVLRQGGPWIDAVVIGLGFFVVGFLLGYSSLFRMIMRLFS